MKVSVIILTYNYGHYIFEALKSIEDQDYPLDLVEVIIIDDGSTDDTPNLIKTYDGKLNIDYHYQENKGKAHATQKAIDLCTGEIIFNLDADDYFYPQKIKSVVNIYKQYPYVGYVAHPAEIIENGVSVGTEKFPVSILKKPLEGKDLLLFYLKNRMLFGGGSTFSAKKEVLQAHPIPLGVDMYIDEYLIYASCLNGEAFYLSEALSVWRVHGKNFSVNNKVNQVEKQKRMLSSSSSMLEYIKTQSNHQEITKLYGLKHLDRYLGTKEKLNRSYTNDLLIILQTIFSFKFSIQDLWKYRIPFKIIPLKLIKLLKNR